MSNQMKIYTEEDIKKAFWKTFHAQGEFWFNYMDDDKTNESSTKPIWQDFKDHLKKRDKDLVNSVKTHLKTLSKEARVEFISSCMEDYCELCGSECLPCYCAPGFDE
jgi:hypothetical protein